MQMQKKQKLNARIKKPLAQNVQIQTGSKEDPVGDQKRKNPFAK